MKPQLCRHPFILFKRGSSTQASRELSPALPRTAVLSRPCQALTTNHRLHEARGIATFGRASSHSSFVASVPRQSPILSSVFLPSKKAYTSLHNCSDRPIHLRSSSAQQLLVVAVLIIAGVLANFSLNTHGQAREPGELRDPTLTDAMASQAPEGRPENLTPEQEEKLRKLWHAVFQLCGVDEGKEATSVDARASHEQAPTAEPEKKRRFGMFRKNRGDSKSAVPSPIGGDSPAKDAEEDDKYGQTKQFHETLANHSPDAIRETIWTMVKHDHPDALALRFLRARKWDVDKALVMMVSTMSWRRSEMRVDDDVMKNGEAGAVEGEKSDDANEKKMGQDFLSQIRMGKSFLHGTDKAGRPICVVRVRLHRQGEQCEESLEKYTVYIIETARMVLSPPVDTATIIFDMTGFSMANMDYTPVKFMIKCFEANYPESLGAVLVHNSPWLFQGIWKVIRGWLDPVVAGKVHFTNSKADLEQFIEPDRILKELGGDEDWEYKYVEPVPGENDKMKDAETRERLLRYRADLVEQFEAATMDWIKKPDGDEGKSIKAKRDKIATQLKEDYWNLDPYVRARSLYDRQGVINPGGNITWYAAPASLPSDAALPETSADDVD